jgi:hypothetical protein
MVVILTGNEPSYLNTTVKQQMYNWLQKQFKLQPNAGMVLDSGATLHIVQREENLRCTGMSDKTVALPNGQTIKATHTVDLPFANLSSEARTAHVLPQLMQPTHW